MVKRSVLRLLVMALLASAVLAGGGSLASAAPPPDPTPPSALIGPYKTAQTLDVGACGSLYGRITDAVIRTSSRNVSPLQCSQVFPNGLQSPIGVQLYYPTDTPPQSKLPVVVWTGGILSEPGNYNRLLQMLASNGYIVAVAYDYVNSYGYLPLIGANAVARANRDPHSPLYGRADLTRTAIAGHSAGGQATQQAASLPGSVWKLIDSSLTLRSATAVEPGPLAVGSLLTVPTLFMSGSDDTVVPSELWVRYTQYNLAQQVPAYLLCARQASHYTILDDLAHNTFAPALLSWVDYTLRQDPTAARQFVGADWALRTDPNFAYVKRNGAANALTAP